MATFKVLLYTSKVLKNGEHPIMLRIIMNRKVKYVSVGYSCPIDLWDLEKNEPKKKHPNKQLLDIVIKQKRIDAEKLLLSLDEKKSYYSLNEVQKKIKKKQGSMGVFPFIEKIIKDLKAANRLGNATVYSDLKNSLMSFTKKQDLCFSDISVSFLMKYEQYYREKNVVKLVKVRTEVKNSKNIRKVYKTEEKGEISRRVKESSMSYYMRTLRSVYNKAITEGEVDRDTYPFRDYKISKFNLETVKRAISREDLREIEKYRFHPESDVFDSVNYFLFSFYCSGINFTDIAQLTWQNVINGRLIYKRAKTGKQYNLGILKPAQDILDHYSTISLGENDYIFPILYSKIHKTEETIRNRIHKVLYQTNEDLKFVSAKAKLSIELTTYVARHSYATILKKSGISTSIISEALGHKSEKTTQIYLDSFENNVLDEANKNIL
jgi:integrase